MELSITLENPNKAAALFGPGDANLRTIREAFGIQIFAREGKIKLSGAAKNVSHAAAVLERLQRAMRRDTPITVKLVADMIGEAAAKEQSDVSGALDVYVAGELIKPKTPGQARYLREVKNNDLVFCSHGPGGRRSRRVYRFLGTSGYNYPQIGRASCRERV